MKNIFRLTAFFCGSLLLLSCAETNTTTEPEQKSSESAVEIEFQMTKPWVEEGEAANVQMRFARPLPQTVTLIWQIIGISSRFQAETGSVIVAAGSTSYSLNLPTVNNSLYDGNGAFTLRVRDQDGKIRDASIFLALQDNDPMPFVSISDAEAVRGTRIDFPVTLSAASNLDTLVSWRTSDVTAHSGADYVAGSGTIMIPAGETRGTVSVNTLPLAADSTFTVQITGSVNGQTADGSATGHVMAGNSLDTKVSFTTSSSTISENAGQASVRVELSRPIGAAVSVDLQLAGNAVEGSDYSAFNRHVTIAPGQLSAQVVIPILNDVYYERTEDLVLRMVGSNNASFGSQIEHTLHITDDDSAPAISVLDSQTNEGGNLQFAVTLDKVSGADTTFSYMTVSGTAGSADFEAQAGTITIPKGSTLANLVISTKQDSIFESAEDLTVVLTEANGATLSRASARGTIRDDDQMGSVQFASATESLGAGIFNVHVVVQLSSVSGTDVAVPFHVGGSSIAGTDHNLASSVVLIPAGQSFGAIDFSVFKRFDPTKTVVITLDAPSNASLGSVIEHTIEF